MCALEAEGKSPLDLLITAGRSTYSQASTVPIEIGQGVNNERVNHSFWAALNDQVGSIEILGTTLSGARDGLLAINKGSWNS